MATDVPAVALLAAPMIITIVLLRFYIFMQHIDCYLWWIYIHVLYKLINIYIIL